MLKFNEFKNKKPKLNESIIDDFGDKINDYIDESYDHFKKLKKPINTLDVIDYVFEKIGVELNDRDLQELYYKITGNELVDYDFDELKKEPKYIVK
jgi:hypothetical protein